jgi:nucleotide-binding universal stress UspA family protein
VLRNASRPVVAVPDEYRPGANVVVAYDGSAQAARSLYAFLAAGLRDFREIHVVSIGPTKLDAARQGDRAVEFLLAHGCQAELHPFVDGRPVEQILLAEFQRLDAGLVVMGAYGHGPWREAFVGSTTRALLHEGNVPLFLYH